MKGIGNPIGNIVASGNPWECMFHIQKEQHSLGCFIKVEHQTLPQASCFFGLFVAAADSSITALKGKSWKHTTPLITLFMRNTYLVDDGCARSVPWCFCASSGTGCRWWPGVLQSQNLLIPFAMHHVWLLEAEATGIALEFSFLHTCAAGFQNFLSWYLNMHHHLCNHAGELWPGALTRNSTTCTHSRTL